MGQDGRKNQRSTRTLMALIVLSLGLVGWHYYALRGGNTSPPEVVVTTVTRPFQTLFSDIAGGLGRVWHCLSGLNQLQQENRRLRALLAGKEVQIDELMGFRQEVYRLRKLVRLKEQFPTQSLTARVIGRNPPGLTQMLLLYVGSREGIRLKDIVIAASSDGSGSDSPEGGSPSRSGRVSGGLVGSIYRVSWDTCNVLLLTDPLSGVGARIQAQRTRAEGVCKGSGEGDCILQYLPRNADVRQGDTVVSSGRGTVFPPGIVIGKVTSVERNDYDSSLEARVRPWVDFNRLEEVQVLLSTPPRGTSP